MSMAKTRGTGLFAACMLLAVFVSPLLQSCESQVEEDTRTEFGAAVESDAGATSSGLGELIQAMSEPYPEGDMRYVSSNPYDYTRDNPAFDQVVAVGYDALRGLEDYLPNHGGLDGYLVCIAIEEITRCDLKQFDEFAWADSNSFRTQWNDYLERMPVLVADMLARGLDPRAQAAEIAKLGAPAVPYTVDHAESIDQQGGAEMATALGAVLLDAETAATVKSFGDLNARAIAQLRAYVEDR